MNTDDRAVVEEYGMTRGVCLDGQPLIARLASGREVVRAVKRCLEEVACDSAEEAGRDSGRKIRRA